MYNEEAHKYWHPVRRKFELKMYGRVLNMDNDDFGSSKDFFAAQELAKLLELPYPRKTYWRTIKLTDELKRKLIMLNSEHFHTIVKMLEAQKAEVS